MPVCNKNSDLTKNVNITFNQLNQLPRQINKCPASISSNTEAVFDQKTGLTTDDFLRAEWNSREKHCMTNVALRIKLIETKMVNLSNGETKMVTNLLATNDRLFEVHVRGWDPYAEKLSGLLADSAYLFSNLYVREPADFVYGGNTGYLLGFQNGSSVRKIFEPESHDRKY